MFEGQAPVASPGHLRRRAASPATGLPPSPTGLAVEERGPVRGSFPSRQAFAKIGLSK
jgi:hypothetical protein